jgi:hypothetical protein
MYTLQNIVPAKPVVSHGEKIEMHLCQVHFLLTGVSAHKEKKVEKTN